MSAAKKLTNEIYLASGGKVFGPYTSAEFETFALSGDIRKFSWIWEPSTESWKALDPAPKTKPGSGIGATLDGAAGLRTSQAHGGRADPTHSPQFSNHADASSIEVICHDFREVLSASLVHMTETGCELMSKDAHGHVSHPPHFALSAPLMLNLYDPMSGKLTNVHGRFYGAERAPGGWKLKVRWNAVPSL